MSRVWEAVFNRSSENDEYLNADDLNRIEGNIEYLSQELYDKKYRIKPIESNIWFMQDIPTTKGINNIYENIKKITSNYYKPCDCPKISKPGEILTVADVNNWEKTLDGVYKLLESSVTYNTWGYFKEENYTYDGLKEYKYKHLKKGLNYPEFIKEPIDINIQNNKTGGL